MKSFATSICPIKNFSRLEYEALGGSPKQSPGHPRGANRSSARRPCPQVLQSHLRVAKQSSIGPSARRPLLQSSQCHPRVAKRSSIRHSARQTCPQVPQRHHPVARRSQTGHLPLLIHEIGLFHGHRGLDRVLIHEIGLFHGH